MSLTIKFVKILLLYWSKI